MKKIKCFIMTFICMLAANSAMADDMPIPVSQLPKAAKTFVQQNFNGKTIVYAEKDWDSYECHLDDGTKVEFTIGGEWKKVNCYGVNGVPANLIPAPILKYVKTNFGGCNIVKIDKEAYGYEVELSNDLDMKFNYQGGLIGMDD